MALLKSVKPHRKGMIIQLPTVGDIQFDNECYCIVADEFVSELLALNIGLELIEGTISDKVTKVNEMEIPLQDGIEIEKDSPIEGVQAIADESIPLTGSFLTKNPPTLEEQLNEKSFKELQTLSVDLKYPEEEWKKHRFKAQMIDYLVPKITNAQLKV